MRRLIVKLDIQVGLETGGLDVPGALTEEPLEELQRERRRSFVFQDGEDAPLRGARQGEDGEHPVRWEPGVGPVAFAAPVQVRVGQQESLLVGAALERDPEGLSHPAAGPVAADEPAGVDLFCRVGIAVSDRGDHA
jgi:hypothetical protein